MSALILNEQLNTKDTKLFNKILKNTKYEKKQDFFESLLNNLLKTEQNDKKKDILIAKLLEFFQKGEIDDKTITNLLQNIKLKDTNTKNSLHDKKIKKENENTLNNSIELETLLKIVFSLKNNKTTNEIPNLNLKIETILQNKSIINEFKKAKNIKELFKIAKQHNIEIVKFEFFKEDFTTPIKELKIKNDSKIKSEEILKLIEKDMSNKTEKNVILLNDTIKPVVTKKEKTTPLQTILKLDQSNKNKTKQTTTITPEQTVIKKEINTKLENKTTTIIKEVTKIEVQNNKQSDAKIQTLKTEKIAQPQITKQSEIKTEITTEKQNDIKTQILKPKEIATQPQTIKQHDIKTEIENIKQNDTKTQILKPKEIATQPQTIKQHDIKIDTENTQLKTIHDKTNIKEQTISITDNEQNTSKNINPITKTQNKEFLNNINSITKNDTIETKEIKHEPINEKISINHAKEVNTIDRKKDIHDIKKTFNTFAMEFKEKVQSYKPPLMKIQIALNPQNLGEVEVTLLNRGNNLHVNINSNPTTIALFAQNQIEFKNSLLNIGFSNLQMNFGQNSQQQNNQRGQNSNSSNNNNSLHDNEHNEIDNFDLVIPQYI